MEYIGEKKATIGQSPICMTEDSLRQKKGNKVEIPLAQILWPLPFSPKMTKR